jgi:hypothetical protein
MTEKRLRRPTLLQLIRLDFLATDTSTLQIAAWAMYLVSVINRAALLNPLLFLALLISAICLPLMLGRLYSLWRVYTFGIEVRGRVVAVHPNGSQVKLLDCVYFHEQQRHQATHTCHVESPLRAGNFITLLVDPRHPRRTAVHDPACDAEK